MPELKKVWIVGDAPSSSGNADYLWDDPAVHGDAHRLAHFCGALEEGGYDIDKAMRVIFGGGAEAWWKEKSKIYTDAASAKADAEKRMAHAKAQYDKRHKQASDIVARVANRYLASIAPR